MQLTDEEIAAALEDAKLKKFVAAEKTEADNRLEFIKSEARRPWNHSELKKFVLDRADELGLPFILDAKNEFLFHMMCYYFTGNDLFEKNAPMDEKGIQRPWSLKKGLLLCGGVGTGKTTLMKAFMFNKRRCYTVLSSRFIASKYADIGAGVIETYGGNLNISSSADTFYQSEIGICIDDLGTEETKKNYGNQSNVIADIILNRYDNSQIPWHYTHITSNLNAVEIEQAYGTRVRSRLREMFNLIPMTGEDRRV
ncbi:hypothetical protein AB6805_30470 [Chitinophaga sp. RCC_12]